MEVAGVDGCKGGWLLVRADATGQLRIEDVSVISTFRELIAATAECAAIAVDIPIGLPAHGPRAADVEARKAIGPRRSSVFPAPMRAALAASTYDEACALSLAACGKKLSKQAFAILPKIRQADEAMTPALQEKVHEVHPEVSFRALSGDQPLEHAKLKPDGAAERLRLLTPAYRDDLASVDLPTGAKRDDLYDACAAAWTAGRIAYGTARRLPAEPPLDSRGLRMEIVY